MTDKGSRVLSSALYLWGFAALAVSLYVSWRFNSGLSADPTDQTVQGIMAVILDAGAVALVVAMGFAFKYGQRLAAGISAVALVGFVALSFVNVLGYSATGAFSKVENAKLAKASDEARAAKANEIMLEERAEDRATLRAELSKALRKKDRDGAEALMAQIGIQAATAPKMETPPPDVVVDAQAAMIAKHVKVDEDTAREYRAAGMSAFLILAKLLGFGLGAHFWPRRKEEIAAALAAPAPAPVVAEEPAAPVLTSPPVLRVVGNDNPDDLVEDDEEILDVAARHKRNVDNVRRFLDERTMETHRGMVHAKGLHVAYCEWCAEVGEESMAKNKFGAILTLEGADRGIHRIRDASGNNIYSGLALLVEGMPVSTAAA